MYTGLLIRKKGLPVGTVHRCIALAPPILLFLLSLLLTGCDNGEMRTVDFSKTVQVAHPGEDRPDRPRVRVAVGAMISPQDTFDLYRQLLAYIGRHMGADLEFVQRKTYSEINELLQRGEIDLAFVCSWPYALGRDKYGLELLATPEIQGSHSYHSYLIVHRDSTIDDLHALRSKTFAFTDPDSNTGRLVPTYWLSLLGERPETFFGQTIYTYSHDNSILAVARGLVDGAAVDSLIWEFYARKHPDLTAGTRIVKRSEPYGIPPVVASEHLGAADKQRAREILLGMHQDQEGRRILDELNIDKFTTPRDEWYASIRQLEMEMRQRTEGTHAGTKP